jgi:hypothetical protein
MFDRQDFLAMLSALPAAIALPSNSRARLVHGLPGPDLLAQAGPPSPTDLTLKFDPKNIVGGGGQAPTPYQISPSSGTVQISACGTNVANEQQAMVSVADPSATVNLQIVPLQLMVGSGVLGVGKWFAAMTLGVSQRYPLPVLTGNELSWTNVWPIIPTGKRNNLPSTFKTSSGEGSATFDHMPLPAGQGHITADFTTGIYGNITLYTLDNILNTVLPIFQAVANAPLAIPATALSVASQYLNIASDVLQAVGTDPQFTVEISGTVGAIEIAAHKLATNVNGGSVLRIPSSPGRFLLVSSAQEVQFNQALAKIAAANQKIQVTPDGLVSVLDSGGNIVNALSGFSMIAFDASASTV